MDASAIREGGSKKRESPVLKKIPSKKGGKKFWVGFVSKNLGLCPSCFVGLGAVGIDFGFGRGKGGTKNVQKFGIWDGNASEVP